MRFRSSLFRLSAFSTACLGLAATPRAEAQTAPAAQDDLFPHLVAIEKALDARRQELHVPGVAFAIIKDDKVIYSRGLGMRDVEKGLPVTPDTLFAIGSSTKAFTAMTTMMSADDGKLSLDASPRKYLPYFHLKDPDTDKHITLSDLLSHRSGLERTDLVWISGRLNSEELIRFLVNVKPSAKLGEKFNYQNLMFLAAGQIIGKVQGAPWTSVVEKRVLKPLGMTHTDTTISAMQRADDYALGYVWNAEKKSYTHVPMRDIRYCAPAGAINSNIKDMAKWVQFMLDGGVWNGKRLVSEKNFAELTVPRITVAGDMKYGYGWFLRDWNGHKVVEHGGNIDGFNAEVALMPDQHLGFVMLTNISASPLGETAQSAVWENLVGKPSAGDAVAVTPAQAVGVYHSDELNLDFKVAQKDDKLTIQNTASEKVIALEPQKDGRYKPGPPVPDGAFFSFRFAKDNPQQTEMFLEQGGTKLAFKRAKAGAVAQAVEKYDGPLKELVGPYKVKTAPISFNVVVQNGKVAFVVPGQPAYPLVEKAKDQYALGNLPADFALLVHRDAAGKVIGATLKQPKQQGDLELLFGGTTSVAAAPAVTLPGADEVMRKTIEAEGGEAAIRRHHSRIMEIRVEIPTQGLYGTTTITAQAPAAQTVEQVFTVAKKPVFTTRDYFDGESGGTESLMSGASIKSGTALEAAKYSSDFYDTLDWKTVYKSVTVLRTEKVGEEECYVLEKIPVVGKAITQYISTKTFLPMKQETLTEVAGVGVLPFTELFSDYRTVDGQKVAFRRIGTNPLMGEMVLTVTRIRFNVAIPASAFQATPKS